MKRILLLGAVGLAALLAAGCDGRVTFADSIDQGSANVHGELRCGADVSGRWWFELRKQLGQSDWDRHGHPGHGFDCPPDENPRQAGYQCTDQTFCALHPVVENFMGLQAGIGYEYRITAAFSGGGVGHTNVLTFVTKSP